MLKKDIMVSKICAYRADYVHFRPISTNQGTDYYRELVNAYRFVYCVFDAIVYSKTGISENYAKELIGSKHQLLIKYLLRNK